MSDTEDESINQREVAYRLFAAEFEDSSLSYSESDDDRAPNYVVTPSGARVNRLFAVGVLTEVEQVSNDVLRGRIVDPTGAFVAYAGQYQPDEQAFLERIETPTFVAMSGKARTFQPDDADQIYTSVRPESFNEVTAETRDRWTVQTASQTIDRIGRMATALSLDRSGGELEQALLELGFDEATAEGIPLALEQYATTPTYLDALYELAADAARVVAGERDEVGELAVAPGQSGPVTVDDLPTEGIDHEAVDTEQTPANDDPEETTSGGIHEPSTAHSPGEPGSATDGSSSESQESSVETSGVGDDETTVTGTGHTQAESDEPDEQAVGAESGGEEEFGGAEPDGKLGDFDPEEFELEEETREQVKEEHGVEFQSGTEVDEPGETEVETPTPEEGTSGQQASSGVETDPVEASADEGGESDAETDGEMSTEQQPEDLQATVVDTMEELDEGEGAKKEALLEEMGDRYGVTDEDVEEAIQSALMDGECYEPSDGTLKPI